MNGYKITTNTSARLGYRVKEIFYTLQGEGSQSGRSSVFLRFSGCNLWSGVEIDRYKSICQFCDTDFLGVNGEFGGVYENNETLAETVLQLWNKETGGVKENRFVVCTGGEPLLQLDQKLVDSLHLNGFSIAIETNGTKIPPKGIDWTCVSPKSNTEVVLRSGNELKVVYPQKNLDMEVFRNWEFEHFYIQPMWGNNVNENVKSSIEFCKRNPKWKLSLQTHKIIGIP